jgi:hypothetical protein
MFIIRKNTRKRRDDFGIVKAKVAKAKDHFSREEYDRRTALDEDIHVVS